MPVIRIRKKVLYKTIAAAIVAAIVLVGYCYRYVITGWLMPCPEVETVEQGSYNVLRADGRDILYFRHVSADSLLLAASLDSNSVRHAERGDTVWRSADLHAVIKSSISDYQRKIQTFDDMEKECDYYLSRNSMQDEGYSMIEQYVCNIDSLRRQCSGVLAALSKIPASSRLTVGHVSVSRPASDAALPSVFMESGGGVWRGGRWYSSVRNGKGVGVDSLDRWLCGTWACDTVTSGCRVDSTGYYVGDFSRGLVAYGHGSYHSIDGTYYQGQFENDTINGFCIALNDDKLRIGEWAKGRYRGQRLNFTTERIYGIDISRYQHGKGRRYYPIHWKQLRIRSLGNLSKKRVTGNVDYPISFIYIKSTEGVSVRNKYYLADYRAARVNGFKCGAYHFFSTKTSGSAQANFFLRHSRFTHGDLPPVLDVEPTHSQIMKMGGVNAMFASIRSWLNIVGRRTGVRPVLYVSQTFVNKYLPQAPDIKKNYNIWIARYGEYKPDVHLVFWQLCPDGRVSGITGEVDVNVFNGYSQQFKQFITEDCVK